jgi:hypothetical protein
MQRVTQFAFRVNKDERRAIAELAKHLKRSQSDAVRFVVIMAARELAAKDRNSQPEPTAQRGAQDANQ